MWRSQRVLCGIEHVGRFPLVCIRDSLDISTYIGVSSTTASTSSPNFRSGSLPITTLDLAPSSGMGPLLSPTEVSVTSTSVPILALSWSPEFLIIVF